MNQREENLRLRQEERILVSLKNNGDVRLVLAYPNRYWVAMSNLGFQGMYRTFAEHPRLKVERAYIPDDPKQDIKCFESDESLSAAEILAISVSFETDYLDVVRLVQAAGRDLSQCMETVRSDSGAPTQRRPLIIGGGAALTLNPEPLANLFDAIVIGEGEEVAAEIMAAYLPWRDSNSSWHELLGDLCSIDGVYVPALYHWRYRPDGMVEKYEVNEKAPLRVQRRVLSDIDAYPTHTVIQTPNTEFRSMFMTETGRGCEIGCRFCVAGYMYRPVRKRTKAALDPTVQLGVESAESVGFVGAAVSSHTDIVELVKDVAGANKRAALSSIMSQKVTKALAEGLSESEYKTVALAPEAGSEELRFRMGKRVLDRQFLQGIEDLAENGIKNFKLYFMLGLPGETGQDVLAIPSLVKLAREAAHKAARRQPNFTQAPSIVLSVNPFIPKAWTPFQRHPFLPNNELRRRIKTVQAGIAKVANVSMKFESPRESYFQTLMSRGDRRVGDLLIWAHQQGYDWRWIVRHGSSRVLKEVPPADFFVYRTFDPQERLPWEVIDMRIKRTLLEREYSRALKEDVSPLISRAHHALKLGSGDSGCEGGL